MATTIDHLSRDHRVTVLRAFTDTYGTAMQAGDTGILREMAFDQLREEIHLDIEQEARMLYLRFALKAPEGPRVGHMKEFLELGDYLPVPGPEPVRRVPGERIMIVPPSPTGTTEESGPDWWAKANALQAAGRTEEAEQAIRAGVPHIGAASSIAEMYAQRMRAFQRQCDEPRAVEAFKKAVDWMGTYAGWATSGGEGAALSLERDEFHAALVREFGYDPTT